MLEIQPKIINDKGIDASNIKGEIVFKDLNFFYPSKPYIFTLQNFNLVIKSGEFLAICGETGCGKSTLVKIIMR